MDILSWKSGKYFFLALIAIIACFWYLLQNDERYLKRKTKELVLLTSFSVPFSGLKSIRRINKITDSLNFEVFFKLEFQGKAQIAKNLQEIKSFLFSYFSQVQTAQWNIESLEVKLKEKTAAFVFLTVKGNFNDKTIQCKTQIEWKKIKKWLITHIQVFSCLPPTLL